MAKEMFFNSFLPRNSKVSWTGFFFKRCQKQADIDIFAESFYLFNEQRKDEVVLINYDTWSDG